MYVDPRFRKLLEPGRIGCMELRNRIIMAPMGTNFAAEDGYITERSKNYYAERAKGGVGLAIVGVGAVDHPRAKCMPNQVAVSDDKFIPGLSELAEAVHRHGAKIAVQLQHAGGVAAEESAQGIAPLTPSPIQPAVAEVLQDMTMQEVTSLMTRFANAPADMTTREITPEEIKRLVVCFAEAAGRAKRAGFDGVEIHAGHGYLIAEFLSRSKNKRQDAYGGELKNRARFLLEIIAAIREKVGKDYPIWCRMDGREFEIEDGITPADGQQLSVMLEQAGLDALHVSGYGGAVEGFYHAPLVYPPGNLIPLAEGIKKLVKIPVIAVGRISPKLGEQILRQGKADFIAMARPLLADPDLPSKLASGKLEDVRPCIYCYNCVGQIFWAESMYCAVNAATGSEADFRIQRTEHTKKVIVVGGGPAGMETARVAALRGHQVTLYEKERRLGGSLFFASTIYPDNEDFLHHLVAQVNKLPVEVKLRQEATPELIERSKPDVVIVALGSQQMTPRIKGGNQRNVLTVADIKQMLAGRFKGDGAKKLSVGQRAVLYLAGPFLRRFLSPSLARRLAKFWMPVGKRVAVIGGDLIGCELATFLVQRGRKVTILESGQGLAGDMAITRRWRVLADLRQGGVDMITEVTYEEITKEGIIISKNGERQTIKANTIVVAEGMQPGRRLLEVLKGKVPEIYEAGDCVELRLIRGAILDGASIGMKV
ncbi:MAG: FAD-dependent oxidoreductase [Chloroflexi bacterium]|nr:FAD-dependent oxidoreductase [Chloroflexota bacterium]